MGVTRIVPHIKIINEIAFLDPFFALRNNPIATGSKNNNRTISNLKLNPNVVNPVTNSEALMLITFPYIVFENWKITKLTATTIRCVIITKIFFLLLISAKIVTRIEIGNISTVIAFEKIDNM